MIDYSSSMCCRLYNNYNNECNNVSILINPNYRSIHCLVNALFELRNLIQRLAVIVFRLKQFLLQGLLSDDILRYLCRYSAIISLEVRKLGSGRKKNINFKYTQAPHHVSTVYEHSPLGLSYCTPFNILSSNSYQPT